MIWSKLKRNIENKFTDDLKGIVQLYITSYHRDYDTFSRGWITVNGKEIVNFSTRDSWCLNGYRYHNATPTDCAQNEKIIYEQRNEGLLSERGEFSKFDLSNCCYAFLDMTIEEGLAHESPIINMLSILDKRLGKRRLLVLQETEQHPLVKYFIDLRLNVGSKNFS